MSACTSSLRAKLWVQLAYTAAVGFASGYVASGTLQGGAFGAFTALITFGIGNTAGLTDGQALFARAMTGGVMESLQGGKFGSGFAAAGLTAMVMPQLGGMQNDVARTAAGALIGGTISAATGGKFANGAISGAVQGALSERQPKMNTSYQNGDAPPNPQVAAQLTSEAEKALTDNGFYKRVAAREFKTEKAIALAWGKIVGPIAHRLGAEAGAWIYELPNGSFAMGGVYSDGAFDNVSPHLAPTLKGYSSTAWMHTHPFLKGGHLLSHPTAVGGVSALGDVVHPGDGDMSWAIDEGKRVYSYGGDVPILSMFDPVTWEAAQVPGAKLTKMCLYTVPAGCSK